MTLVFPPLLSLGPRERYAAFDWIVRTNLTSISVLIEDWFPYDTTGRQIFPDIVEVIPGQQAVSHEEYVKLPLSQQCLSKSEKLWLIGANNLIMAPVALIFGRRALVKCLTRGLLGNQGSPMWPVTMCIMTVLHVVGTTINTTLVKHTVGFSHIKISQLVILWLSRPRISWLVVLALPVEAERSMYFSATASTLATEAILQLAGAYYLGYPANHGRKINIYRKAILDNPPYGSALQLMYAGGLFWKLSGLSSVSISVSPM